MDWDLLPLGGPAKGSVHEIQPYGILYDLDAHPDLVGLITTAQVRQLWTAVLGFCCGL